MLLPKIICPFCGEQNAIRSHCDYVTREVDEYMCEACGWTWLPNQEGTDEVTVKLVA